MLARLQQAWVVSLVAIAVLCAGSMLSAGWPWWFALVCGLAAINVHAVALAAEFALLSRVHPGPRIQRPTAAELVTAWWGEIWTGWRVFCWRQPFRSNALPNRLERSATGKRGVVLVHGFVCNRGLWNPWMRRLSELDAPFVAVNLEPVFGSIDGYVQPIDDAVAQMEALTGRPPVIVAHSMGGLAVRAWLRDRRAEQRVHSAVTIGAPHEGTWLARLAVTANARQMRRSNPWLHSLAAGESAQRRALFTCFFGHCDNIVFPASTAMLPGADNRHLPGVAHLHMAFHPAVYAEVLGRL
jgi:triacylglycerol esterase/lipase EstA (alpha/beta hydrolase family)